MNIQQLIIPFMIALVTSFLCTYPLKKFAYKFGILDYPNHRKLHQGAIPRFGGLAIFFGASLGLLYLQPEHEHMQAIVLGAIVILITGLLDDKYDIRPIVKLTGQLIAASFLISSGLIIERVTIPVFGVVELGFISVLVTILWVVGITNAINLIDGLDGLASGVTTIAMTSMLVMAIIDGQVVAAYLCIVLIGANLGFLYHNFYPAKIYMGDAGSNFLGYMIATISMLGLFKNVTFFSFIIPLIILAVPIFDTFLVIVRRLVRKENIMMPDNKHIHYQLIANGFSHRKSVLIIYAFSLLFGILAILFSKATLTTSFIITIFVLILLHIIAELAGLIMDGQKPLLNFLSKPFRKKNQPIKDKGDNE